MYRHGGGELGFELSLRIAEQGVTRLAPGGRLLLYTGSAIVDGVDAFHDALSSRLTERGVELTTKKSIPTFSAKSPIIHLTIARIALPW
jgi:hypothetical protein